MEPKPALFWFVEEGDRIGLKAVHPLPKNKLLKVGAAGMGFVLMHRSVVDKIREELPSTPFFSELGYGSNFMGEDIHFFSLCDKLDIPVYAHTGATVPHMKRFSYDEHFYDAFYGEKRK
jgi:hypothetical protein